MRHLYVIHDGGERHHYSATSPEQALEQHYSSNGMCCDGNRDEYPVDSVAQEPDDKIIGMHEDGDGELTRKTAKEWAEMEEGLVGSTVY